MEPLFYGINPNNDLYIRIYLVFGTKREEIVGIFEYRGQIYLKIAIMAKAVDNKANKSLLELVGKMLKLAPSRVEILFGNKSQTKTLIIKNAEQEVLERIKELTWTQK